MAKQNQKKPQSQAKNQTQKAVPKQKNNVDPVIYDKYADLKMMELAGAKFGDEKKKEIQVLEKQLKEFDGPTAKKNATVAIGAEKVKLIIGVSIPQYIVDLLGEKYMGHYLNL